MKILDSLRMKNSATELPLVYVREAVVFPQTLAPILAATKFCAAAAELSFSGDKLVVIALLRSMPADGANDIDVHDVGTLSHIIQAVKLNDGSTRLLVEGRKRVRIKRTVYRKDYLGALIEHIDDDMTGDDAGGAEAPGEQAGVSEASGGASGTAAGASGTAALLQIIRKDFITYSDLLRKIPPETVQAVQRADSVHAICNIVGNAMGLKIEKKQELLSVIKPRDRLECTATMLAQEIEMLSLQKKISQKVRARMEKTQKDYFLQEQVKEINRELGRDVEENEYAELERRIEEKNPPKEVADKAKKELARLAKLQPMSPEAGILRTYCEWVADLPWAAKKLDTAEIARARAILDEDHYGMKKAKERILEYIAVRKLNPSLKGPILCLVGPPGTGKTSLGRSIARALGRDFVRMSLGGVRDEAEIRGHRKTYVGALPGKILQCMRKAGSSNPVFLLDEIDKMSSDFRGDPASALLEVLDPEQNSSFSDHYLELPYDLSGVVFVTTANSLHGIPYPLLDRMEILEIPGYSEYEKLSIAKNFIIPKQLEENGLGTSGVKIRDDAVLEVIRHYTMESGVRSLEREIARMIRKTAEAAVESGVSAESDSVGSYKRIIHENTVAKLLGKRKHEGGLVFSEPGPGIACGLAWTELGGTVLPVEVSNFEGEGELILTGNLGDVMKESARAALTYLRAHGPKYGLTAKSFSGRTLHVHVPEGAIPKDGPSAGITLASAILSSILDKAIAPGWAMTGEITLTGRVLAIGGVKEKLLAAHRHKMAKVILPEPNRKDIDDIPPEVVQALELRFVDTIEDVFSILFPKGSWSGAAAKPRSKTKKET